MENRTGGEPATRPDTADPHNANEASDSTHADGNASDSGKPVLSLVSDSPGHSSHVEDGFFAKGAADDKAALEMYAAMLPRGFSWKQINPRYLLMAGAAVLLLVGVAAGRHLPGGSQTQVAQTPPAEGNPSVAPAPAIPAPAAAAPAAPSPVPAAAVPVNPETTAPAPSVAAAPAGQPGAPVAMPAPQAAAPAELIAKQEAPAPAPTVAAAPAEQPAAQPDKAASPVAAAPAEQPAAQPDKASAPTVAAAPAEQPAAQPDKPAAPVVAAPAPEPKPAAEPVAAAPAEPAAAEAPSVQACRNAIKKRDTKGVSASCETALTADASLAKPLLSFAKAQFEKGRSAQAAVWARKIVQVNGSLADAYLIMGAAEQEARHAAAAKAAYQRYLELAPRGPYADDVRSSLKSL